MFRDRFYAYSDNGGTSWNETRLTNDGILYEVLANQDMIGHYNAITAYTYTEGGATKTAVIPVYMATKLVGDPGSGTFRTTEHIYNRRIVFTH
jgi:hypothetical protein